MSKDLLFSIILHIAAVGAAFFSSPFEHTKKVDLGDVIKVRLTSAAEIRSLETPALPPPVIPKASLEDDFVDIPLDDPRTVKQKKEVKKPEVEPKPEKKPEKKEPIQTTEQKPAEKEIETASTAEGQIFEGAIVHSATFDYPYWFDLAISKIISNMRNTVSSDSPLVCKIYFEVIQSGRVITVQVVESSDITIFDESCISAIRNSAPFPPLPREFREEILGISLPFSTGRTGD